MKYFASLVLALSIGCGTNNDSCVGNDCVCATGAACTFACAPGSQCDVQCAPGEPCDVTCNAQQVCHVECSGASSCRVDCKNSPECHVTAPSANATVTDCTQGPCIVACGTTGEATYNGTTATCP